jgi:hypothetical protein
MLKPETSLNLFSDFNGRAEAILPMFLLSMINGHRLSFFTETELSGIRI